jgi:hypothetical protein
MPLTESPQLEIIREAGHYADRKRAYKLIVDEKLVGEIREGESVTVAVEPGTHHVLARIAWCRSPVVEVDLAPGDCLALRCRPHRLQPWAAIFLVTFGRSRYISLTLAE